MRIGLYNTCFMHWDITQTFQWMAAHDILTAELHGGPRYTFADWQAAAKGQTKWLLEPAEKYGIELSGIMFGALPFLSQDEDKRDQARNYLFVLLDAAAEARIPVVSVFTGRDPMKSIEENLDLFAKVFPRYAEYAEKKGVTLAFENCPMAQYWPPQFNIAVTPAIWEEMFSRVPSKALGINFDPSHLIWQGIDYIDAIYKFNDRIVIAQAKDTEVVPHIQRVEGMFSNGWWRHRIPGQGQVNWNSYIAALQEIGYQGPVNIEHEDPFWEGSDERVIQGLLLAKEHLQQFISVRKGVEVK